MMFLNDEAKIRKIRKELVFDPPSKDFLEKVKLELNEVSDWFQCKKEEFVTHMRGIQKGENIMQSELAIIDVGLLISILLTMENSSLNPTSILKIATKKALEDCKME